MLLRKNQRELVESIENSKEILQQKIEKTDELNSKLEALKYEKSCIENEIFRIKKLDTQELACLGISIIGEKSLVLQNFENEFLARKNLKNELTKKETELEDSKKTLEKIDLKIKSFSESLKKISASDSLNSLISNFEYFCLCFRFRIVKFRIFGFFSILSINFKQFLLTPDFLSYSQNEHNCFTKNKPYP